MEKIDILIVDDEADLREVMGEMVILKGYSFKTAENAQAAIDFMQNFSISLILCDISMPGLSGLELLEKLKSKGLPSAVVMMTAYSESDKIIKAVQLGCLD